MRQQRVKCSVCGGTCLWAEDAWVCRRKSCGSEWYPDHGPEYAAPWTQYVAQATTQAGRQVIRIFDKERHAYPALYAGKAVPQHFASLGEAQAWADEHLNEPPDDAWPEGGQ